MTNPKSNAIAARTQSQVSPASTAPLLANFGEQNWLGAAVDRFLGRDEIGQNFYFGTTGVVTSLPDRPEARLELLKRLPAPMQCWTLQTMIEDELASPVSPTEVVAMVRPILAAWPNAARLGPEYHAAMLALLAEEAVTSCWPRAALVGGLVRLLKSATFAPSIAEVFAAIRAEKTRLHEAALLAGQMAETAGQIEDRLIASGHLDPEEEE